MENEVEELKDLPQPWIDLLNSMPKIKKEIIIDKKNNESEMIPPYFLEYFSENYMQCKPYFLCFERGEEVFNNFYSLYGGNELISKDVDNVTLESLLVKRMEEINSLLELSGEEPYDISKIKFEETTYDILNKEYDLSDIDEVDIKDCFDDTMTFDILPNETENPIVAFEETLYNLTSDYNLVYYILWPLGKKDDIANPFETYVKLWEKGIKIYVINKNLVKYIKN